MIFQSLQELSARLFTKLTQEGSTLGNPVVLRLFGRQMDKNNKVCGEKKRKIRHVLHVIKQNKIHEILVRFQD